MEEQSIPQPQPPAQPSEQPPAEPPAQQPPVTPVSPKEFPWKRLIMILLTFIIVAGGIGIGLAWRTTYLDDYLPASVKEFFGRKEEPAPTLPSAPIISSVKAINITESETTITWATDVAATSQVEYGTTSAYGSQTEEDTTLKTSHSVTLSGLSEETLFHYRVKSKDGSGNLSFSEDYTFTTKRSKKNLTFRIDEEDLDEVYITEVIVIYENGKEEVLRRYEYPPDGPARGLYPSKDNRFLGIEIGTGPLGGLEIVDLDNKKTVRLLSLYGKAIWIDDHRLALTVPEEVNPPRPYEGGEGSSLATYDAVADDYKVIKTANGNTNYGLWKVEGEKIFFHKGTVTDPNDWTNSTDTKWKINFDGSGEEQIS